MGTLLPAVLTHSKNGPQDLRPHMASVRVGSPRLTGRFGAVTHKWKIFDLHLNEAVSPLSPSA